MAQENFHMWINGETSAGDNRLNIINPATEQILHTLQTGSTRHLEQAVAAAKAAFVKWRNVEIKQRQNCLAKLAQTLQQHKQALAELLTAEIGRPLAHSIIEVNIASAVLQHASSQSLAVEILKQNEKFSLELHRRPLGVVAAIVPWNMPLIQAVSKIAPALLMGNTVVLKPAPSAPLAVLKFAELAQPFLPGGVLNTLLDNNDLGATLCAHADVAKISFTGSTETGFQVAHAAADSLKRMTLELGGSDAAIVTEAAQVDKAATQLMNLLTFNCGQICTAAKRIYVQQSVFDEFCEHAVTTLNHHKPGDGMQASSTMGPLQNSLQYQKTLNYLAQAKTNGKVLCGGNAITGKGYFVQPTLVTELADDADLVVQEQFCPLIPVLSYQDEAEVIERANNSRYGLGGSVWSTNRDQARALALQLDCGQIWINQHNAGDIAAPSLGAKQSGIGAVLGTEGLKAQTQLQVLNEKIVAA